MKADIIAVDIGTSSCKAVLFSDNGEIMATGRGSYPLLIKENNWVEQDPEIIFQQVLESLQQIENRVEDLNSLRCISFCAQMSAQFLVDREGIPLTNMISWMDRRAELETEQLNRDFSKKRMEEISGMDMVITPAYGIPKLMWLKKHMPDILKKSAFFVQIKDYVIFRLTGNWCSDPTSLKGLVNQENGTPLNEIWTYLGLNSKILPEVKKPYEKAGVLKKGIAKLQKIRAGVTIVTGWNDMNAAFLGMGALLEDGIGLDMTGTSEHFGWCGYAVQDTVQYEGNNCVPYLDGRNIIYGVSSSSGLAIEWYIKEYLQNEDVGYYMQQMLYDCETRPVSSERPLFLPYLEGERNPWNNPKARGVFFGISREHQQRDMLESVLEGICFELKAICDRLPCLPKRVVVSGGASDNPVWNQMKADIFGTKIQTINVQEAGCTGAAFLGMKALEENISLEEISQKRIKVKTEYDPDSTVQEIYQKRYEKFLQLYRTLENSFWKKEGTV